jgi:hypothetical protein
MGYMRYRPPPEWIDPKVNHQYLGLTQLISYYHENRPNKKEYKGIEIGSFMGESTQMFLSSGLWTSGFYAVDPWAGPDDEYKKVKDDEQEVTWKDVRDEFNYNTRMYGPVVPNYIHQKFHVIRGKSKSAVELFEDEFFDFIYIDADHTYDSVCLDIQLYLPKLKKGGFIAGHDYDPQGWPEVVEAVHAMLGEPDKVFMDTSWIFEIK